MKKILKEFPGYEVDDCGIIYSQRTGKPLSTFVESGGRVRVTLRDSCGKRYKRAISRLVAVTFICNPLGKNQVDHIDGNRSNNNHTNLRWVTNMENTAYREAQGISMKSRKPIIYDGILYSGIRELSRVLAKSRSCKEDTVRKELQKTRFGAITLYGKKCKLG